MNIPYELRSPIDSVLCIEDNVANLALVEHLITRRGDLKFLSASTGTQGVQMACEHLPVAILVDINLPDINGYDVLKYLRSIPATAHIPVMALSADAYFHQIEQGIAAGFCQYLTKPFKIAELMEALDMCLTIGADTTHRDSLAVHRPMHDSTGYPLPASGAVQSYSEPI